MRELADDLERLDADIVFLQEVASLAAARVSAKRSATAVTQARRPAVGSSPG